jgi:hypothetical protein
MADVSPKLVESLMVVCTNNGSGWKPRKVLPPHQLYTKAIEEWRKEDPSIYEVAVFPLDHEAFITVWK